MLNRKALLLLALSGLSVIFFQTLISNSSFHQVLAQSKLEVIPPEFSVKVPTTKIDNVPTYSLQIISTDDIDNVSTVFSSMRAQEDGKMWISRDAITPNPRTFNLKHGNVTNVDISLKLPNETGTYRGTLAITSPDKILRIIDTKIEIVQPIPIWSIVAVASGVIVAFLIKYVKIRMVIRSSALEVIEKFRTSSLKAHREGRVDSSFMTGNEEAARALKYFKNGDFEYAKQAIENAIDSVNSAKTAPIREGQGLKTGFFNAMFDEVRTKGLRSLFKNQNSIIFFLTSSAVFIVILQTWLQVYNQIQTSGESFLGIIVAFLLGYGTQSLLGEAFDTKAQ
jgi:hypothetical protein